MKDETIHYMFESIQVNPGSILIRFKFYMNRFSASERVLWDVPNKSRFIHESIHGDV